MSKIKTTAKTVAKADRKATHRAAKARDTPVVKALGAASEIADQPPLIALAAGTMLVGAVLRQPVMLRTGARMLLAEILATGIKTGIKKTVVRTRPEKAIATGRHAFAPGKDESHEESSFPSGHTAGAVAVSRALAQDVPGVALPAYVTASAIAAVQMPRGKHYVIDAVAGAAIGYVAERVASAGLRSAEAALASVIRPRPRP